MRTGHTGGGGTASSIVVVGQNGESYTMTSITELVTIAAAATTTTSSNLIPANSWVMGVVLRVTVAIPTAATFTVQIAIDLTTLFSGVSVAANTTDTMFANQQLAPFFHPSPARPLLITPNLTPASSTGRVRITTFYGSLTAPTS